MESYVKTQAWSMFMAAAIQTGKAEPKAAQVADRALEELATRAKAWNAEDEKEHDEFMARLVKDAEGSALPGGVVLSPGPLSPEALENAFKDSVPATGKVDSIIDRTKADNPGEFEDMRTGGV